METNLICPENFVYSWATPLSEAQVQELSKSEKTPEWIMLPKFWSFQDFLSSDFFTKYYDLGEKIFQYNPDLHVLQKYKIDESIFIIQKLHRALIVLGYLELDALSGNYCDLEPDSLICSDAQLSNDAFLFFWTFWDNTIRAVTDFQKDQKIRADSIVGPETKNTLYYALFYNFHFENREICLQQSKQIRKSFHQNLVE